MKINNAIEYRLVINNINLCKHVGRLFLFN